MTLFECSRVELFGEVGHLDPRTVADHRRWRFEEAGRVLEMELAPVVGLPLRLLPGSEFIQVGREIAGSVHNFARLGHWRQQLHAVLAEHRAAWAADQFTGARHRSGSRLEELDHPGGQLARGGGMQIEVTVRDNRRHGHLA
jgi:hypothetical protein